MVTMLRSMLPFLIVVGHPALHGSKEEEARKDRPSFVCPFLHQRFPSGGGGSERETLRARSSGGERAGASERGRASGDGGRGGGGGFLVRLPWRHYAHNTLHRGRLSSRPSLTENNFSIQSYASFLPLQNATSKRKNPGFGTF